MQDPVFIYQVKIFQNYWVSQFNQLRSHSFGTGAKVKYFRNHERWRSLRREAFAVASRRERI
ncbi:MULTISPECIES: hypothetical protein [unclassified Nostoc]|uniref:hypothetical protein n=1 Tax=unclassified Nostoc TaxID=2593658 RepID=UPI0026106A24|nr:hypothetical protein [Nostoc sp. S13]MDF5739465.1 hypothetical protein [Nostoc sp. S13]